MIAKFQDICHFASGFNSVILRVHEMDRQYPSLARAKTRIPAGDLLAENSPAGRFVHGLRKGGG